MTENIETPAADAAKINKLRDPSYTPTSAEFHAAEEAAVPVDDEMHPVWCQQTVACVAHTPFVGDFEHAGQHVQWKPATDDVVISLDVFRRDHFVWWNGKQKVDTTAARLSVESTALVFEDGTPVRTETELGVEDIDLMMLFLKRARDQISKPGRELSRCPDDAATDAILRERVLAEVADSVRQAVPYPAPTAHLPDKEAPADAVSPADAVTEVLTANAPGGKVAMPPWATNVDQESGLLVWTVDASASATDADGNTFNPTLSQSDTEGGKDSGVPFIFTGHSDDMFTVPQARILAAGIVELCDKADGVKL